MTKYHSDTFTQVYQEMHPTGLGRQTITQDQLWNTLVFAAPDISKFVTLVSEAIVTTRHEMTTYQQDRGFVESMRVKILAMEEVLNRVRDINQRLLDADSLAAATHEQFNNTFGVQ